MASTSIKSLSGIIKVTFEPPCNSFASSKPELVFEYDYSTGKYSYSFGGSKLCQEDINRIISFLKNKSNIDSFFNFSEVNEGFGDSREYLTIEYNGEKKTIRQNIFDPKYNHPFNINTTTIVVMPKVHNRGSRRHSCTSVVGDEFMQVFFPLKNEFVEYVKKNLNTKNSRSKNDVISRMNSVFNGYTPKNSEITISVVEDDLAECIYAIPRIVVSKKVYHSIALQILAALFIKINKKIEEYPNLPALRSMRSALVHYYSFIEDVLLNTTRPKAGKLSDDEAQDLRTKIGAFYDENPNVICITQKEVQENFKQRLHSQDRLYNHKLLFPITLIVKLLTGPFVAKEWTYKTINDIDILTGISKKNRIKFKDVSFFMFSSKGIFVFNRKGKKFQVFTKKYKVIEIKPVPMKVHDFEQPLQSFAIDHVQPMQQLLENINVTLVPDLKQLSDDFLSFITNHGQKYLKESWVDGHPSANGLDLLTSKTINDLANGYIKSLGSKKPNAGDLINDIKTLHADCGLELMDKFENGKKGGEVE